MISVAKPLRSQGHTMLLTATELYTVIPVRQLGGLKQTPPLSRTNWSFNYWGLSLCVCCIWIHISDSNPKLTKHSIASVCVVLSMHVNYVYYLFVFCLLYAAEQSSARRVKKKNNNKKSVWERRRVWAWLFCCLASHNCFTVSEEEQLMPVLSSMSQCAWIFLKILSSTAKRHSFARFSVVLWMSFVMDYCYT